jgi:type 1 glutamine amidotransferase
MNKKYLSLHIIALFFLINSTSAQTKQFKALLVTTTKGWHHESLHSGVLAIQQLGVKNYFDVVLFEDPESFTDKNMEQFKVVIFLNTTGDIFDSAQQKVLERFIQSGKGFVGIHSASDTEYGWDWYTKLIGRMFEIHPVIQTARINAIDPNFPGLQGFTNNKIWTDEWYEFGPEKVSDLKYLLTVDETTYNPKANWASKHKKGNGMGNFHPFAWYHNYDGGRSFYTALGHLPSAYSDPVFLNHLLAGIYWAATGKK